MMKLSTILAMLSFSLYAGEVDEVKAAIHSSWETIAKGKDSGLTHPEGGWIATSEGSFESNIKPRQLAEFFVCGMMCRFELGVKCYYVY